MSIYNKVILFIFLFSGLFVLSAQSSKEKLNEIVNGVVYGMDGNPLSNVTITLDEGRSRFVTESDGKFSFMATKTSVFIFEHANYEDYIVSIQGLKRQNFLVALKEKHENKWTGNLVNLPYHQKRRNAVVGDISVIDATNEYWRDSRSNIASAINGKVLGSLGGMNINGLGNAFTVVDGIPMGVNYTDLRDVEQIVVLRDPSTRLLYGVETDIPVVLITTKSGKPYKKDMQFMVEHGVQRAIAYPKFLDAASYMQTYNRAHRNDGAVEDFYSLERIERTKSGTDPVLYPDNNYYSSNYIKNMSNYTNVYGTVSGGNEKTQFSLNIDWLSNPGWNTVNNTSNNVFKIKGRVDFDVNRWLKMNSQVLAAYNITAGSNIGDFWNKANTILPNAYPELIPTNRINNLDSLSNYYEPYPGYLLGGTSIYQSTLQGDLMRSGSFSEMRRYIQSRIGFNIDLSGITKGLRADASVGYDFYNVYKQIIQNNYSVYEINKIDSMNNFSVKRIGIDQVTTQQSVNSLDMGFNRSVKWNYSIKYNQTFNKHCISALALGYGSYYTEQDLTQPPRKISFGGQASYMFDDKYLIEAGLLSQSSMKVNPAERIGYSKSIGLGWVMSNESFFNSNDLISYLKLRGSYGQFVSDAFTSGNYNGYFLNENLYSTSFNYLYNNGRISNRQIQILSFFNQVDWEKRNELSLGFEMALIENKLRLDATYTNSFAFDNVTSMNALKPSVVGGITTYENFNATDYKSYSIGVKYQEKIGEFELNMALYYTRNDAVISKLAENVYVDPGKMHLTRTGTDARGLWGLTAERLFMPEDFDHSGKLKDGIPLPSWGNVKAGDIKYIDYNNDGFINEDDVSLIGRNNNNVQLAFNLDFKYKQWQLFMLPLAQMGGSGFKNSNYYWFRGNSAKYSEHALQAYDIHNPDPNASYPRISLGSSPNNYRNSTYWMYDRTYFQLLAAQLSYNLYLKNNPVVNNIRLYAKGNNLFMIAKDKDVLQLNYGSSPQSRIFALGAIVIF
jgi:TonB-linked SusC/RagA family outer membrane protein